MAKSAGVMMFALVLSAGPVTAAPILFAQSVAQVSGSGDPEVRSMSAASGTVSASVSDDAVIPLLQSVSSRATARGTYGDLGVFAEASGTSFTPFGVSAGANGIAQWFDDFTITSSTFGIGTPVLFRATGTLDGSLDILEQGVGPSTSHSQGAGANMEVTVAGASVISTIRDLIWADATFCSHCGALPSATTTFISLPVGVTVQISQRLFVQAAISNMLNGAASADFSSTATFAFEPVGDGYGYVTASGTQYNAVVNPPSSVPEPRVGILIGTAFLICVGKVSLTTGRRLTVPKQRRKAEQATLVP